MSDTGDVLRCNHFMEAAYKKTHYEAPAPSFMDKVSAREAQIDEELNDLALQVRPSLCV